jgi:hypothetical protein
LILRPDRESARARQRRQLHNVVGRKPGVSDCQRLQLLHSRGLLRSSFRPGGAIAHLPASRARRTSPATGEKALEALGDQPSHGGTGKRKISGNVMASQKLEFLRKIDPRRATSPQRGKTALRAGFGRIAHHKSGTGVAFATAREPGQLIYRRQQYGQGHADIGEKAALFRPRTPA